VLVSAVIESRCTFHPEWNFTPDTLDLSNQPRQMSLLSLSILVSTLGHQQIRDNSYTVVTQKFGDQYIRVWGISLFRLEIPCRGDGKMTTLVGV
jgi:hypothetical protein